VVKFGCRIAAPYYYPVFLSFLIIFSCRHRPTPYSSFEESVKICEICGQTDATAVWLPHRRDMSICSQFTPRKVRSEQNRTFHPPLHDG
jgi:hypothetical protein